MGNIRLVYSDDPRDKVKCPKCGKLMDECKCIHQQDPNATKWTARVRVETGGRGGKTVTVIDTLPLNESFLKDLLKEIKTKCGVGGTYKLEKHGVIEVQGDKRPQIKALFEKKGYSFKGL